MSEIENNRASVLITGASGGFGREFARQMEGMGFRLLLHGRDASRLQLTLRAMQHPERHQCITADMSHSDGIISLIEQLRGETALTGLVNNAGFGVWGAFERVQMMPQHDVLHADLIAPTMLTHALLPQLIRQKGFIINVSSLAGETPLPWMSTYAAAKAGLTWWSEALRMELKNKVRVVTLAPGPSPTGFREISGMPKGKGSSFCTPATDIIEATLNTLHKGGGFCVPGMRHKLLYTLQKIIPRPLAIRMIYHHLRR